MSLMIHCDEASRLQSERLDRPLRLSERLALGFHLTMCSACRLFGRQIRAIDETMAELPPEADAHNLPPLPADARKRIEQALETAQAANGNHGGAA